MAMSTYKIEIIKTYFLGEDKFIEGETRVVFEAVAKRLCELGYARDPSETYATGERRPGVTMLQPNDVLLTHPARGAGVKA